MLWKKASLVQIIAGEINTPLMCKAAQRSQASSCEGRVPPITPASRFFLGAGQFFSVPLAAFQTLSCEGFWSCLPLQLCSAWVRGRREEKSHSPGSDHLQPRLKHISLNPPKSLPLPNMKVSFLSFLLQLQATTPCPPLCLSPHAG